MSLDHPPGHSWSQLLIAALARDSPVPPLAAVGLQWTPLVRVSLSSRCQFSGHGDSRRLAIGRGCYLPLCCLSIDIRLTAGTVSHRPLRRHAKSPQTGARLITISAVPSRNQIPNLPADRVVVHPDFAAINHCLCFLWRHLLSTPIRFLELSPDNRDVLLGLRVNERTLRANYQPDRDSVLRSGTATSVRQFKHGRVVPRIAF